MRRQNKLEGKCFGPEEHSDEAGVRKITVCPRDGERLPVWEKCLTARCGSVVDGE